MQDNFGSLIAQVTRLLRRSFDEKVRDLGITRPQWHVLGILIRHPGIHQTAIAEILEVEPVSAGRMIDRMQDAGLIERRADPADRRAWRIHLTGKGRGLYEELRPLALETIDLALEGLDRRQRDELVSTLAHVRANLMQRGESEARNGTDG